MGQLTGPAAWGRARPAVPVSRPQAAARSSTWSTKHIESKFCTLGTNRLVIHSLLFSSLPSLSFPSLPFPLLTFSFLSFPSFSFSFLFLLGLPLLAFFLSQSFSHYLDPSFF